MINLEESCKREKIPEFIHAAAIPPLGHQEAGVQALEELRRFLEVIEQLEATDWNKPTACSQWTVKDILAHQAGACAGYASWIEFFRQYVFNPHIRTAAVPVDGVNQRQVQDRSEHSPAELMAELRQVGPKAIRTRQRLPRLLRNLRVRMSAPIHMTIQISYLTDLIYIRDMWMHRLDICRATDRPFLQTTDHDGRIVALVMLDVNKNLKEILQDRGVVFELLGAAGGTFHMGMEGRADAVMRMDVLDFNFLASGRLDVQQAISQDFVVFGDDERLAKQALDHSMVVF